MNRKFINLFLISLSLLLLIGLSDFIYLFRNQPKEFGRIFIFFALKESKRGNLSQVMLNLDKAADFHLKQNKIIYKDKKIEAKAESNPGKIDIKTKREALTYLARILPIAFEKNSSPVISNIYYNLGLIFYKNNLYGEASALFSTAVYLDPELGHLYIELADSYFRDSMIEKGLNILSDCQKFRWPKKQCKKYLESNVKMSNFLPVGIYRDDIYRLQKKYF